MGIADGPTEVHKVTVARQVLKQLPAGRGALPDASTCPTGGREARKRFAHLLDLRGRANLLTAEDDRRQG